MGVDGNIMLMYFKGIGLEDVDWLLWLRIRKSGEVL
jgi:hypothetical protein